MPSLSISDALSHAILNVELWGLQKAAEAKAPLYKWGSFIYKTTLSLALHSLRWQHAVRDGKILKIIEVQKHQQVDPFGGTHSF